MLAAKASTEAAAAREAARSSFARALDAAVAPVTIDGQREKGNQRYGFAGYPTLGGNSTIVEPAASGTSSE